LREENNTGDLIIVDGYNFIFKFFKQEGSSSENLIYLREKLIEDLAWYKIQKNCSITVVFDGKNSSNPGRSTQIIDDVKVIYSGRGETADEIIEELVDRKSEYRKVFVVTSDYSQQKVVFRKNIYRKSVREFDLEIKDYKDKIREEIKLLKKKSDSAFFSIEKRLSDKTKKKFLELRDK